MLRWFCPACGLEVEAVALEVEHRCPVARKRVAFVTRSEARVDNQGSLL